MNPGRPKRTPLPAESPGDERLDSWKEIAAYLKREVRTLHRWEAHEGLPVHRHLHRERGSVYAYKSELDSWWNNRRAKLERPASGVETAGRTSRLRLALALTSLALLLSGALYLAGPRIWPHETSRRVMLAVLPFEDLGERADEDYFSDGLTDELITQL